MFFLIDMKYSALFKNVLEAAYLLLFILLYLCSRVWPPSNDIWLLVRVLPWLAIGDFYHIM